MSEVLVQLESEQYAFIISIFLNDLERGFESLINAQATEKQLTDYNFYGLLFNECSRVSTRNGVDDDYETWKMCYELLKARESEEEMNEDEEMKVPDVRSYQSPQIPGIIHSITKAVNESLPQWKIYQKAHVIEMLKSLLENDINIDKAIVNGKLKDWNISWYKDNFNNILLRILKHTYMSCIGKYEMINGFNNDMKMELLSVCLMNNKFQEFEFKKVHQSIILQFVKAEENMIKRYYDDIFDFNIPLPAYVQSTMDGFSIMDEFYLPELYQNMVEKIPFIEDEEVVDQVLKCLQNAVLEYSRNKKNIRFQSIEDEFLLSYDGDMNILPQQFNQNFPNGFFRTKDSLNMRLKRLHMNMFFSEVFENMDWFEKLQECRKIDALQVLDRFYSGFLSNNQIADELRNIKTISLAENYFSYRKAQQQQRSLRVIQNTTSMKDILSGKKREIKEMLESIKEKITQIPNRAEDSVVDEENDGYNNYYDNSNNYYDNSCSEIYTSDDKMDEFQKASDGFNNDYADENNSSNGNRYENDDNNRSKNKSSTSSKSSNNHENADKNNSSNGNRYENDDKNRSKSSKSSNGNRYENDDKNRSKSSKSRAPIHTDQNSQKFSSLISYIDKNCDIKESLLPPSKTLLTVKSSNEQFVLPIDELGLAIDVSWEKNIVNLDNESHIVDLDSEITNAREFKEIYHDTSFNNEVPYYFLGFHKIGNQENKSLVMVPFNVKQDRIIWKLYIDSTEKFCKNRRSHFFSKNYFRIGNYELWHKPVSNVISKDTWKGVNQTIKFEELLKKFKNPLIYELGKPNDIPAIPCNKPKLSPHELEKMRKYLNNQYRFPENCRVPTYKEYITKLRYYAQNNMPMPFSKKICLSDVLNLCEEFVKDNKIDTMYLFLYILYSDHSFIFEDLVKDIDRKDILSLKAQADIDKMFGKCDCDPKTVTSSPYSRKTDMELEQYLLNALFKNGEADPCKYTFDSEANKKFKQESFFSYNSVNPKHSSIKDGNYIKVFHSDNHPYNIWIKFDDERVIHPKKIIWNKIKHFAGYATSSIVKGHVYTIDEDSQDEGDGANDEDGIYIYGYLKVIMLSILDLSQQYKLSICVQGFGEKAYVKKDIPTNKNIYFPFDDDNVIKKFVDDFMIDANATVKHTILMVKFLLLLSNVPWIKDTVPIIEIGTGVDWSATYLKNGDKREATCMVQPFEGTYKDKISSQDITSYFDENNNSILQSGGLKHYPTANGLFNGALAGSTCKVAKGISIFDTDLNIGDNNLNKKCKEIIEKTNEEKLHKECQVYRSLWAYLLSKILGIAGSSSIHCKGDVNAAFKSSTPISSILETIKGEADKQSKIFGISMSFNFGGPVRNEILSTLVTKEDKPKSIIFKDIDEFIKEKLRKLYKSQFAICSRGKYYDADNILMMCQLISKMELYMGRQICNLLVTEKELSRLGDAIDVMWGIDTLLLRGAYIPGREKNLCFFGSVLNCLNRPVLPALGPSIINNLSRKINMDDIQRALSYLKLNNKYASVYPPFQIKQQTIKNVSDRRQQRKVCRYCFLIQDMSTQHCINDKCNCTNKVTSFVELDRGNEHIELLTEIEKSLKNNVEQYKALQFSLNNNDILIIIGKGGSGKSYVINCIHLFYDFRYGNSSTRVLCYQNRQTDPIDGETINSFFMIGLVAPEIFNTMKDLIDKKWQDIETKLNDQTQYDQTMARILGILSVDIFIFDESQLIPSIMFDLIDAIYKQMFKLVYRNRDVNPLFLNGKKVVISCDFFQLGAINKTFKETSIYNDGSFENVLQSLCLKVNRMRLVEFTKNHRVEGSELLENDPEELLSTTEILDAIRMNDDSDKVKKAIDQISLHWGKQFDCRFLREFLSNSLSILDLEFEQYLFQSVSAFFAGSNQEYTKLKNFINQFVYERSDDPASIAFVLVKNASSIWSNLVSQFFYKLRNCLNWSEVHQCVKSVLLNGEDQFSKSALIDKNKMNKYNSNINEYLNSMDERNDVISDEMKYDDINILVTRTSERLYANEVLRKCYHNSADLKEVKAIDEYKSLELTDTDEMKRLCVAHLVNQEIGDLLASKLELYIGCRVTATVCIETEHVRIEKDDRFIVKKISEKHLELQCLNGDKVICMPRMEMKCKIFYRRYFDVTRQQYPLKYSNIYNIHECIGFGFDTIFISLLRFGKSATVGNKSEIDHKIYTLLSRLTNRNKICMYPPLKPDMIANSEIMKKFLAKLQDNGNVDIYWDHDKKSWEDKQVTDDQTLTISKTTSFYDSDDEINEVTSSLNFVDTLPMFDGITHRYSFLLELCSDNLRVKIDSEGHQILYIDPSSPPEAVNVISNNNDIKNIDTLIWNDSELDQHNVTKTIMDALTNKVKISYRNYYYGKNETIISKYGIEITNQTFFRCCSPSNGLDQCTNLNADIVDFYMAMLNDREARNISLFFQSRELQIIFKLLEDKKQLGAIKDKLPTDYTISYFTLFLPISRNDDNWAIAIIYINKKVIWFSDTKLKEDYLDKLLKFLVDVWCLKLEQHEWSYIVYDRPQDHDGESFYSGRAQHHNGERFYSGVFTLLCADYLSKNWDIKYVEKHMNTFRPTLCSYILTGSLNPCQLNDKYDVHRFNNMQSNCNCPLLLTDFLQHKTILKNGYKNCFFGQLTDILIKSMDDTTISEMSFKTYKPDQDNCFLKEWLDRVKDEDLENVTIATFSDFAKCRVFVYTNPIPNDACYYCHRMYNFSSEFTKDIFLYLDYNNKCYNVLVPSNGEGISSSERKRKYADDLVQDSNSYRQKRKYDAIDSSTKRDKVKIKKDDSSYDSAEADDDDIFS